MSKLDVKVGDRIQTTARFDRTTFELHTVERLTKTQAVCGNGVAFRLDSGLKIGTANAWRPIYGKVVSDADIAELEAEKTMRDRLTKARADLGCFVITAENVAAVEALLAPKPQLGGA